MKISIITINRNNSEGLAKTFASVALQNRNNIEFIVIDGASTDNSLSMIDANKDLIDYVISEPDSGIYDAMNKGIKVATGDYLFFLNSGDIFYDSTVLDVFVKKNYTQDFILGGVCFVSGTLQYKSYLPKKMSFFDFLEGVCHQGSFIKRSVFNKVGKYDLKYKITADWVLLIKAILLEKCSYLVHHDIVSYYNLDGLSSQSSSKFEAEKEKKIFLYENHIEYNGFLFYLYRFSYRILKIRFFYKLSQIKARKNENTSNK